MSDEQMDGMSMDIEMAERDKLRSVFPQCFSDGRLDIDKLLSLCGEYITDDFEKYEFRWKGKSECLQLAGKRSMGTLRPCPEESVDFDSTQNLYIEGDNLEVLKLLQTSYYRKVKMIYIDPPYNTGNDFVYEDNFADPLARYREVTQQTTKSNPETMGRFHTNWLNMMYPRLRLAANLLRDDGVIFISIDDNEVHNLRKVCDEVFGEENFLSQIIVVNNLKGRNDRKNVATCHEYLLIYGKGDFEANGLPLTEEQKAAFNKLDEHGNKYQLRDLRKRGQGDRKEDRPNMHFPIYFDEITKQCSLDFHENWVEIYPVRGDGSAGRWRWGKDRVANHLSILDAKKVRNSDKWGIEYRVFLNPSMNDATDSDDETVEVEERDSKSKSFWNSPELSTDVARRQLKSLFNNPLFEFPKSVDIIKKALYMGTDHSDLILDFFSGSATTAHAVMQLNAEDGGNRRFILVQLPEVTDEKSEAYKAGYKNICEIGKERIRRAGQKIRNAECGIRNEPIEQNNSELRTPNSELDIGFRVFKLDSSNLKVWNDSPISGENAEETFEQRLWDYLDVLVEGRCDMDLVYEVMLKLGQDLCLPVVPLSLEGDRKVYGVGEDIKFIVCLAKNITPEDAEAMAAYAPGRIVFAEQCFTSSTDKSNVRLTLKDKGIAIKTL